MKTTSLVDQCCEAYGMSLREFADHYNLSEPTLKRWRDSKKLPPYGKLLFESMIKIKELEKNTRLLDDMADYFNNQKMK
jgi:DNA-binding transcriptional regulator YiaG